jgi:hypothetical protein
VRAHVARLCARRAELPLVRAHERDFREESGPKCAELPHVRGFSRGTALRARALAGFPRGVRRTRVGARPRGELRCTACIEVPLVVDHVPGFNANIRPRGGIRCAFCIEELLAVDHVASFGALGTRCAQRSASSEPAMKSRSSWRVCTDSLLYTERRCVLTVFLEIESFSAIHVALLPCAKSSMTSSSRAERP